jgi:hypothetical protein
MTLTATLTSTAGTPTGTVTFMNGTTVLGTATLGSGMGVLTSSSLASGAYTVSAVYSGDPDFAGATATSPLAIADYTLAASPSTLTIAAGQSVTTTITITPIANYKGTVALTCGTLPADITCSFSTSSPPLDGTGTPENAILTISTNGSVGALARPARRPESRVAAASLLGLPALLGGLLLAVAGGSGRRRRKLQGLLLAIVSTGVMALSACGSSGTANLAAEGTDTVVVTASSASPLAHTLNLTVMVQ